MSLRHMFTSLFQSAPRTSPHQASDRIRSGAALLVDIRESDEWADGVAESAALLPFSDLQRARAHWTPFLSEVGDRELLLYCASGMRSSVAARLLAAEGIRAVNAGGLHDWAAAGWPIVAPPRGHRHATKGKP